MHPNDFISIYLQGPSCAARSRHIFKEYNPTSSNDTLPSLSLFIIFLATAEQSLLSTRSFTKTSLGMWSIRSFREIFVKYSGGLSSSRILSSTSSISWAFDLSPIYSSISQDLISSIISIKRYHSQSCICCAQHG